MLAPSCKVHNTLMHPLMESRLTEGEPVIIIYNHWVCDDCEKEIEYIQNASLKPTEVN